jgi:hypothetical protein
MWGPIWKITKIRRLGDVAQAVELLSSKYQGPEFKPSTAKKRQGGWDSCFISYWFPNLATINKLFFNPSRYFVQLIYADIVFRGFLSFLYFYPKGSTPQSGFKYFLCLALCAELFFFPHVRSSLPFPTLFSAQRGSYQWVPLSPGFWLGLATGVPHLLLVLRQSGNSSSRLLALSHCTVSLSPAQTLTHNLSLYLSLHRIQLRCAISFLLGP